jgi:phage terminase large subunit-like protein
VTWYAKQVTAKKIVAGPHVRNACKRHLRDLEGGAKRGLTFDLDAVDKHIGFFRDVLKLNSGQFEGDPFEVNGWEGFVLGSIFGWKRADGTRRFRFAYIETAKGSGKSPLAAGIGIAMMCIDGEPRAEVYAAAVKQDQAKVLFRDATAMVRLSDELGEHLMMSGGTQHPSNIAHVRSGSFFRPISSERQGRGHSGPKPHCVLLDEIHEHPTNAMVEFLSAGVKSRRQPLVFMITNSGSDRQTVCWEYHSYAIEICAGTKTNDEFFGYVCALDKNDEPFKDESCWVKANPSLPEIPGYDYIRSEVAKAKGMPGKETLVRRLNFCEWTDAADAWLNREIWQRVQTKLNIDDYAGRECFGGLDLSLTADLTALVLAFPWEDDPRRWDLFSWFWMPGDRLVEFENKANMAPYFREWRDDGYLNAPPGKVIDFDHAAMFIAEVCSRFRVKGIAYDRAKIEHLRGPLEAIGCDAPLVEHGQGFYKAKDTGLWMPHGIEETEAALHEQRLRVNENPVLSYCVASAITRSSNLQPTDRYFDKKNASGRIDGAVAMAMTIGLATSKYREPDYQMIIF